MERRLMAPELYLELEDRCLPDDDYQNGVYALVCAPTRMFYFGTTGRSFIERWCEHIRMLEARGRFNRQLQEDYDEFGSQEKTFWWLIIAVTGNPHRIERNCIALWTERGMYYNNPRQRSRAQSASG